MKKTSKADMVKIASGLHPDLPPLLLELFAGLADALYAANAGIEALQYTIAKSREALDQIQGRLPAGTAAKKSNLPPEAPPPDFVRQVRKANNFETTWENPPMER